jgi:hypothetical protein
VLWLEVPNLVDAKSNPDDPQFFPDRIEEWLRKLYAQSKAAAPALPAFEPMVDYSVSIQQLVGVVCGEDAQCKVLLIVDGYDEVPETHQEFFADSILVPFNLKKCTRILMSYRDQTGLPHIDLRLNQKIYPLAGTDPLDPAAQFDRFKKQCQLYTVEFDELRSQLVHFNWDNPFANFYLFDKALSGDGGNLKQFKADTIKDCVHALLERPFISADPAQGISRYPTVNVSDYQKLSQLSTLAPGFTPDEISRELSTIFFSDNFIKDLISLYGVLLPVTGTQRFRLLESVRALLLDEKELREKEPRP